MRFGLRLRIRPMHVLVPMDVASLRIASFPRIQDAFVFWSTSSLIKGDNVGLNVFQEGCTHVVYQPSHYEAQATSAWLGNIPVLQ